MVEPEELISVFSKLNLEQINQLFELVDASITDQPLDMTKFFKIVGKGMTSTDVLDLNESLYNFSMGVSSPEIILKIVDDSTLKTETKEALKKNIKSLHARLPPEKITLHRAKTIAEEFGHPHVHNITAMAEYRPISNDNGKFQKIVPSFVVTVSIQSQKHEDPPQLVDFQMDVKAFENLINQLQDTLKIAKLEMEEFKNKFGEDIIDG